MKFKLREEFLTEGKNLQKTFDQYKDKLKKYLDSDNPFESSENSLYSFMLQIMSWDPTFQPDGTTTGDYGIWLLNQFLKDNIDYKGEYAADTAGFITKESIKDLLNDFIEKKSNLANKDINSYKSPSELADILEQIEFSTR